MWFLDFKLHKIDEMELKKIFRFHNKMLLISPITSELCLSSSTRTKGKSSVKSTTASSVTSSKFLTLSSAAFIILLIIQVLFIRNCTGDPIESSTDRNAISQTSSTSSGSSTSVSGSSSVRSSSSLLSSSSSSSSSSATKAYVPVTTTPKVSKRAGTLTDTKSKKTITIKETQTQNRSREALSHEGTEHESIVYLPDPASYIPIPSYRGGRLPQPPPPPSPPSGSGSISPSGIGTGGGSTAGYHIHHPHGGPVELDVWRPDPWDRDYNKRLRYNNTRVQHIEAECQDDYMKIRIGFNGSFTGLLYSAGYAYDPDCMYINGSGRDYYEFYIQLNRCGTLGKNALHDDNRKNPTNFMWNTITVQYNPLIEEEFDEHFKVTCEYGYDFWKTVTFPFLDVEVATGNPVVFTLSPPECYMEIRNGYGVSGTRVSGPVRVGDPLTLIIYMRSKYDGFDIVVNDCYAHNGANKRIQLIDEYGCPVDDKLISRFRGTWTDAGVYETQVYAYMKTFRFTGSPALYIECDVRMCHGRCPSQPCHWRNLKGVSKRDVSNQTVPTTKSTGENVNSLEDKKEVSLSENINLFQSLRVLQEGEGDDLDDRIIPRKQVTTETCIRTTVLSALSATFSIILCVLSAALMIACAKLKYRKKDSGLYNAYVNHKGQID